jgi:uncharacterized membrane protein
MHDDRTTGERVADDIAHFGGSWLFIFSFLGFMAAWIILNSVVLVRVAHTQSFDPFPYIALNLMLSALAGLQAPIILLSQNRAAAKTDALAAHHYREGEQLRQVLDGQSELLQENTRLTEEVHRLSTEIRELVAQSGS